MANFPFVPGNDSANNLQKSIEGAEQGATPITPIAGRRKLYARNDGWYQVNSAGSANKLGDVTGAASALGDEIALFNLTTGKIIKAATGTGFVKVTGGVFQTPSANISTSSIIGRTDGSAPSSANIGYTLVASAATPQAQTNTSTPRTVASLLAVPTGYWMLSATCQVRANTTSFTDNTNFAISGTPAAFTGTTDGLDRFSIAATSSTQYTSGSIACYIFNVTTVSKDFFLVAQCTYSGANHPSFLGTITAVRIA
jgi:hypothetical protein